MLRRRHTKKEIETALAYAEQHGWSVRDGGTGHAWGKIYRPYNNGECRCGEFCISSVWSTPKNPGNHARHLRRIADNCTARR
ncbi:conserved hypothetical protein [Burkholderia sp. H160]|nr:conserved hypothetical protein [Burkholderia sp. H160]